MFKGTFDLPVWFDLGATFAFAITGALAGVKRGYDIVGVLVLAVVSGLGGGLIRDGLFLSQGPAALLTNPEYLFVVSLAALVGAPFGNLVRRFQRVIAWVDAVGLGAYAIVGFQKSLGAGLGLGAAVFVGLVNAVGGGLLRDIITREEPLVLKPGQFYVLTALLGTLTFIVVGTHLNVTATQAALVAMAVTFLFRSITIAFNWRTAPVASGSYFTRGEDPPTPTP
jgi:uncharacterized membrane protein YeiH